PRSTPPRPRGRPRHGPRGRAAEGTGEHARPRCLRLPMPPAEAGAAGRAQPPPKEGGAMSLETPLTLVIAGLSAAIALGALAKAVVEYVHQAVRSVRSSSLICVGA